MKDKIYTIKEIDELLKKKTEELLRYEILDVVIDNVSINLGNDNIDTYEIAKYGISQNIILLTKNDGTDRVFERVTKDGTIVEGSSEGDTEWREVGYEVMTTENKKWLKITKQTIKS